MCLATKKHMEPIISAEGDRFKDGETFVKDTWIDYVLGMMLFGRARAVYCFEVSEWMR